MLSLSVVFHHKAEAYASAVGGWGAQCAVALQLATGQGGAPCNDPRALEQHAQRHRQLLEHMCQAYTEVSPGRPSALSSARLLIRASAGRSTRRVRNCCTSSTTWCRCATRPTQPTW